MILDNKIDKARIIVSVGIVALFLCIGIVLSILLYVVNSKVRYIDANLVKQAEATYSYDVNEIRKESTAYYIDGYCCRLGEDTALTSTRVALLDREVNALIVCPTEARIDPVINTIVDDGHEHQNAGYHAMIQHSKLEQKKYEICLIVDENGEDCVIHSSLELENDI